MNGMKKETIRDLLKIQETASGSINILDSGRYDENAHTEFLASLLRHRNGCFVHSFLDAMLDASCGEILADEEFTVSTQVTIKTGRRPDLVVSSKSLYVVIENKVCCAGDGGEQIHDYWNHVQEVCANEKKRPILIYLTLAGGSPSEWSITTEERDKISEQRCYYECSYRHNIIPWLTEQVVPKCLNSERALIASLDVYLDYLIRKTGGFAEAALTDKLIEVLTRRENVPPENLYAYVKKQQGDIEVLCSRNGVSDIERREMEMLLRVLETVRRRLINDNVFLDEAETAYNLKWLLKNNPTVRYKNMGMFKMGVFTSIGQFTYGGAKYVQCATSGRDPNVRIHVSCNMAQQLKCGPYVLSDILQCGSSVRVREDMEKVGFVWDRGAFWLGEAVSRTEGPADIIALAREVEKVVRLVETAVPALRENNK